MVVVLGVSLPVRDKSGRWIAGDSGWEVLFFGVGAFLAFGGGGGHVFEEGEGGGGRDDDEVGDKLCLLGRHCTHR